MDNAPEQPRFELHRLAEYTDEAIVAELRRVAALVPDRAFVMSDLARLGRVGPNTSRRRFGSWFKALAAAGLAHRSTDEIKTRGGHASTRMSDDQLLSALRELAGRLGRTALTNSDVVEHLPFSDAVLRKRWGSLRSAFEAAGLEATPLGRRYTDEACFANMLVVWTHLGRPPMHREMSEPPSTVGGKAYMKRFGTWNKALAAFAERVDSDTDGPTEQNFETPVIGSGASDDVPPPRERSREESRDIKLGLRYRVLHRDRFKCFLCGDHPARNAQCVLHVDHVVPWSKGGRTREDNLRTLCATCNVGRGNRYYD